MPFKNVHSARVRNPDLFSTCRTISIDTGINAIYCKLKDEDRWQIQAYRFNKNQFTPAQAKAWLKDHDISYISFEEAVEKDQGGDSNMDEKSIQFSFVRKDSKQHIISGIILEPDSLDNDEEFADAEEIEKASINFMMKYADGEVGNTISHTKYLQSRYEGAQVKLIENYVAPVDIKVSKDTTIKKGSWVQSYKVFDIDLWDMIEDEKIVGFSMGADLYKTPIED